MTLFCCSSDGIIIIVKVNIILNLSDQIKILENSNVCLQIPCGHVIFPNSHVDHLNAPCNTVAVSPNSDKTRLHFSATLAEAFESRRALSTLYDIQSRNPDFESHLAPEWDTAMLFYVRPQLPHSKTASYLSVCWRTKSFFVITTRFRAIIFMMGEGGGTSCLRGT